MKDTIVPTVSYTNYCDADLGSQMTVIIVSNFAMNILNVKFSFDNKNSLQDHILCLSFKRKKKN